MAAVITPDALVSRSGNDEISTVIGSLGTTVDGVLSLLGSFLPSSDQVRRILNLISQMSAKVPSAPTVSSVKSSPPSRIPPLIWLVSWAMSPMNLRMKSLILSM